jgi:hypothetical protein
MKLIEFKCDARPHLRLTALEKHCHAGTIFLAQTINGLVKLSGLN